MFNSPFEKEKKKDITIPANCDLVFVADLFAEDYIGGAELTTQALIDSVPDDIQIHKIYSKDISLKTLESGYNKYWVFGNFSQMDHKLLPSIIANLNYSILEYDYKFCKYRSIEKHESIENKSCDCAENIHGKLISAFFHAAQSVFWMSEKQKQTCFNIFPFLASTDEGSKQYVLSSVFDDMFFATIKVLKEKAKNLKRKGWIVLGSASWIKGTSDAIAWCTENEKEFEVIQNLPYNEVLKKFSTAEGFVYLPKGGDTCPRMVLEAQLLGCKLHLNDNVQHAPEFPFTDGTMEDIETYLYGRRDAFWQQTMSDMNWKPTISGYVTTYNCIKQKYPYEESILSLLGFCDEIIVVDGGSTDGTYEKLKSLSNSSNFKIKVLQNKVDWTAKRSAVHDGLQKAVARKACTSKFCWQKDSDEIVHENDYEKIIKLCRQFPKFVDLISLPVIEYWGGDKKIRMDVTPWKWRLSRNKPNITHGIPKQLRKHDEDGLLYAALGTDGCDYIDSETFELIPHASFYTEEIHNCRAHALSGNTQAHEQYASYITRLIDLMPCIYHYSWFNIERKIKTYKGFWQRHWESLYNIKQEDTAQNNMFFDKKWADVTEEDIKILAKDLSEKMGGWVFHEKVDFDKSPPHLELPISQPKLMSINE